MAKVTKDAFGQTKDGQPIHRFTLSNTSNVTVRVINFGANIVDIQVPDRNGDVLDINQGFDDIDGWQENSHHFGSVIGRVANRIAGGEFQLDGQTYKLPKNDNCGPNCCHGGVIGFHKKVWDASIDGQKVVLKYISEDKEEGFPGKVTTTVTYEVTDANELVIDYTATTTKPTLVDLTNHAYFNLGGHDSGVIGDHVVTIHADNFLEIDDTYIPTGKIADVTGTCMDFRKPVELDKVLDKVKGEKGFGHYYVAGSSGTKKLVARVEHPKSGRYIETYTTEPGLIFYTAWYTNNLKGKGGTVYGRLSGVCFEAQNYPDSIHHEKFPSRILRPGDVYRQTTTYKFGITT